MTEDTEVPNISEKASRHTVTSLKVSTVKKTASTAKAGSLTTMISATCVLPLSVLPLMRTVILSSKRAELIKNFRQRIQLWLNGLRLLSETIIHTVL